MVQTAFNTEVSKPLPNRYTRMTGAQLSQALDDPKINLTVGKFARLTGTQTRRVLQWIDGKEEIPHFVPVMLSLMTLPGAIDMALAVTNTFIIEQDED